MTKLIDRQKLQCVEHLSIDYPSKVLVSELSNCRATALAPSDSISVTTLAASSALLLYVTIASTPLFGKVQYSTFAQSATRSGDDRNFSIVSSH